MNENQPEVAVVIPTFNRAEMVCKCVASVFASDWKNLRVAVVDDCSPDGTAAALQRGFADELASGRLRYSRNERNSFQAVSRNNGARLFPDADFYLFLDDDNIVSPGMVRELVAAFARHPKAGQRFQPLDLAAQGQPAEHSGSAPGGSERRFPYNIQSQCVHGIGGGVPRRENMRRRRLRRVVRADFRGVGLRLARNRVGFRGVDNETRGHGALRLPGARLRAGIAATGHREALPHVLFRPQPSALRAPPFQFPAERQRASRLRAAVVPVLLRSRAAQQEAGHFLFLYNAKILLL